MRYRTAKRAKFDRDNAEWRRAFIEEVNHCQLCGCKEGETHPDGHYAMSLCVHEMCPGAFRLKSIEQGREACMVVCWFCNSVKLPGMKLAKQIAYKSASINCQHVGSATFAIVQRAAISEIIAAVRAVKQNGRNPLIVTVEDVMKELEG